jgi:MFS family permease
MRLAALAIGQVVSWGVLYYAVIVAGSRIEKDTGWSLALVNGLFAVGLVVSAVAGVVVGRALDRSGPRRVMTLGSITGVAGFVVVATAPNPFWFGIGWIIVGVAQSAVFYEAAFTVLTHRYGERRQGPLTILTLAGGFASTIFAPVVAGLLAVMDWRGVFLVLAGVLAVVTIPLHWFSLERSWPERQATYSDIDEYTVTRVLRTRRFWFLEVATVAVTIALAVVTLTAIPLFTEKGMSFELAAIALGLIGAGQVIGRMLYLAMPRRVSPWVPLAVVAVLAAVGLAALAWLSGPFWLLIVVGIFVGAVRGALTLVRASAVSARWGTRTYGALNGVYAAPVTIVGALSPAVGPLIASAVGAYSGMALVMVGVALAAALLARGS